MTQRHWRGWTTRENAARYEALLRDEVLVGIKNRNINGLEDIQLLRRDEGSEVEFLVVMTFESVQSIKAFVGEDYEVAYVPEKARAILSRFDERARHYEVRVAGVDELR